MVGMKELLLLVAAICILIALFTPNFVPPRDRSLRTACIQSLGTWRKVFEMYANDTKEKWKYPIELDGHKGIADEKLLNAFSKYVNITNTLNVCNETKFSVTKLSYTIFASAKDRNHTLLTLTPEGIQQP